MNLTKFPRPCNHFGIIFEQEKGKRGTLCIKHGTLSIVSHFCSWEICLSMRQISLRERVEIA